MLMTIDTKYARFELPNALQERLTWLLDQQNEHGTLTDTERREAEGLVEVAEFLSKLKLGAQRLEGAA